MPTRRVLLTFPLEQIKEPVIYTMGRRFDVVTNIRRANVEATEGWVVLELEGTEEAIDRSIAYASQLGVVINDMSGDIIEG